MSGRQDNVGVLLRKTVHTDITKVGTLTPHREFEAEVYVLKKEEGGRPAKVRN